MSIQASTSFSHSIDRIRTLVKRIRFRRFLLLSLLFSSFFLCITLLVFRIFLPKPIQLFQFLVPVALGMVASMVHLRIRHQRLTDLLIDLDSRFEFKELLATAYEYYKSKKDSVFYRPLLQEASARLDSLSDKQITQRRMSSLTIAVASLTVVGVILLFMAPLLLKPNLPDPKLNLLATRMEEFTNQQPIRMLREENKHGSEIFAELRNLAEKIKTQSIEQSRIDSSIASLKEQVSQERRQIIDSLNQQLQANKIPMGDALGDEKIEMQELVKLVESYFEDGLPDDLKKQLNELEQFGTTAKFLDRMSDELKDLYDRLPKIKRKGSETIDGKHANKSGEEKVQSDKQSDAADQDDSVRSRGGSGNNDDELPDQLADKESAEDSNLFSSASNSKSTGKQSDSYDIAASTEQPDILRGDRGDGDWTDIKIRSSTTIGEVKMKKRLVIREYQKDLNSILLKERFPRKHQQTIKNYFLQIGLEGGGEENGTTE